MNPLEELIRMMAGLEGSPPIPLCRDVVESFGVSTVRTKDLGLETAIIDRNGTQVVERYKDEGAARLGHAHWVQFVKSGERRVKSLGLPSGLFGLVPDEEIELEPIPLGVPIFREETES
jgi:hypothetical protein